MKICILCEDKFVSEVRESAKKVVYTEPLRIPVSPTGKEPITHWFCELNLSNDNYQKIISMRKYTTIEESSKDVFLEKYNLKIVK